MILHSNSGIGSAGPCSCYLATCHPSEGPDPIPLKAGSCRTAKRGILTSHVCSGGGLTQGRETESFLGSHLSPGPLLGSKQQKEEKRTVIKVRKFKGRHVKGVYLSATRITQEDEI